MLLAFHLCPNICLSSHFPVRCSVPPVVSQDQDKLSNRADDFGFENATPPSYISSRGDIVEQAVKC